MNSNITLDIRAYPIGTPVQCSSATVAEREEVKEKLSGNAQNEHNPLEKFFP